MPSNDAKWVKARDRDTQAGMVLRDAAAARDQAESTGSPKQDEKNKKIRARRVKAAEQHKAESEAHRRRAVVRVLGRKK